jgi:hypothetical protein
MEKKAIILIEGPPEDIAKGLKMYFDEYYPKETLNQEPDMNPGERLTRRQAAKFLDVSYQSIDNYVKRGLVKPRGIGKKQFYLKSELIEVLKNIK